MNQEGFRRKFQRGRLVEMAREIYYGEDRSIYYGLACVDPKNKEYWSKIRIAAEIANLTGPGQTLKIIVGNASLRDEEMVMRSRAHKISQHLQGRILRWTPSVVRWGPHICLNVRKHLNSPSEVAA